MIKEVRNLTVNNYSDVKVEYSEVKANQEEFDGIQSKALYFLSKEKPKKMFSKKTKKGMKYSTGINNSLGMKWYCYENTTINKILNETV